MGDRVTRSPQSKELVRAKKLRQALDRGAAPAFVPPTVPSVEPSSLSWNLVPLSTGATSSEATTSETTNSGAILDSRRQYLEQIFQSSPDPLIITGTSFEAQCVNQEFQRMFGYSASEILGRSIDELIFPSDRAAEALWITQCLQRGEPLTLQPQRRCKDGTLLDV